MTLGKNGVLRFFSDFSSIFGDRMANLGLIDFKIVLYIKFEVRIYQLGQNGHQLSQNRPDLALFTLG